MASNALELSIKIAGKIDSSFNAAISTAQRQSSGLAKTLSTIGKAGLALEGTVLTGVVAMMKSCAEYAQDTETSMADVAKYVNGLTNSEGKVTDEVWNEVDPVTGEQIGNGKTYKENYDEMASELYKLSTQFDLTPEELMTMASDLGQSGYDAEELAKTDKNGNVTGVLRDTATMAAAFDIDTAQAGEWMAKWENAFGATHDEIMVLNDQINYLGNTSATTAAEIGEAVNRAGSLGTLSGVDTGTTAALATVMLQAGGDSSTVGTSLNRIFTNMMKGSSATDAQETAWNKLGFTAEEVASRMISDGPTLMKEVFTKISELDEDKRTATISTLFGQWAISDVARVVANIPELETAMDKVKITGYDENGNAVGVFTGSMEAEANTRNSTTAATEQMKENARDYMRWTIGQQLLPAMEQYNTVMRDFYITLAEHAPELAEVAGSFADVLESFAERLGDILDRALPYLQNGLSWLADNPETAVKAVGGITATFATMAVAPQIESAGRVLFGGSTGTSKGILGTVANILTGGSKTEKSKGILGTLFSGGQSAGKAIANSPSAVSEVFGAAKTLWQVSGEESKLSGKGGFFSTLGTAAKSLMPSALLNYGNNVSSAVDKLGNTDLVTGTGKLFGKGSSAIKSAAGNIWKSLFAIKTLDVGTAIESATETAVTSTSLVPTIGNALKSSSVGQYMSNVTSSISALKGTKIGTSLLTAGENALTTQEGKADSNDTYNVPWWDILSGSSRSGHVDVSDIIDVDFRDVTDVAATAKKTDLIGMITQTGNHALNTIKGTGSAVANSAPVQFIGGTIGKAGSGIKKVGGAIRTGAGAVGQFLGSGLGVVGSVLSPFTSSFMSLFSGVAPIIGVIGTLIGLFTILQGHIGDVRMFIRNTFGVDALHVFNQFYNTVNGIFEKIGIFISGGWLDAFNKAKEFLTTQFGEGVGNAFGALQPGLEAVFSFVQKIVTFGQNVCAPIIEQIGAYIAETVAPQLLQLLTTMAPLLGTIGNLLGGLIMTSVTLLGNLLGQIIIPAIEWIMTGILNFANAVAPTVVSVIEGIVATVTTVVNGIISAINWFIEKVDTLSFDIPEWVPFAGGQHIGFDFEPLPLLANGGFTSGPSIAGEAGTEAVISFKPSERARNITNWLHAGEMLNVSKAFSTTNNSSTAKNSTVVLPMFANGGFTSGPSIAGEAGTEAVISFKPSERARNIANWLRAGEMLDVGGTFSTASSSVEDNRTNSVANISGHLANHVVNSKFISIAKTIVGNSVVGNTVPLLESAGFGGRPSVADNTASLVPWWKEQTPSKGAELKQIGEGDAYRGNPGGETVTFAPVLQFYGDVTKEKAVEAGQISFAEFERLYNEMMRRKARTSWR